MSERTLTMGTNNTENWERRLKGETVALSSTMEPDYGFYRVPTKDRTSWRAVAYWYEGDGRLGCHLDGNALDEERAMLIWPASSKHPITHELYKAVREGQPWPDMNPVVTLSNNAPDDNSFEGIQAVIDNLSREAERLMKLAPQGATTQEQADQAANVANKLAECEQRADLTREVEKRPHLDKCNEIQAKWKPLLATAAVHKTLKQIVCGPWLSKLKREKDRREAEANQIAQAARNKALQEEADARTKAAEAERTGDVAAIAEAGLQAERAKDATQQAVAAVHTAQAIATSTVTVGTTGRRGVHLRAAKKYSVGDRDKMFGFLKTNAKAVEEIDTVMLKHAKAIDKAGLAVPGLTIEDDEMAA
jgi:hypothetical protein